MGSVEDGGLVDSELVSQPMLAVILLAKGFNVNAIDMAGRSALIQAYVQEETAVVELPVARGAYENAAVLVIARSKVGTSFVGGRN
jgi:hypothetical protein